LYFRGEILNTEIAFFSNVKEIRIIRWFSLDFNLLTILSIFIIHCYTFKLLIFFFWFLCVLKLFILSQQIKSDSCWTT